MPVADTSWLVALHSPEDQNHTRALKDAPAAVPLYLPTSILGEFLQVITRKVRLERGGSDADREARQVLRSLMDTPGVEVGDSAEPSGIQKVYLTGGRISYFDATAIEEARSRATELLTFDAAQKRLFARLKTA